MDVLGITVHTATTNSGLADDVFLFWFVLADAGMLIIASCYLAWRMFCRNNKLFHGVRKPVRDGVGNPGGGCVIHNRVVSNPVSNPVPNLVSNSLLNVMKLVVLLACTAWTVNLLYQPLSALGQPPGAQQNESTTARNEAFHARIDEKTSMLERRLTKLENLPELVAAQQTAQKMLHDQLVVLQKSVQDLIELQRNLFVGILLAVVAAALQLAERWLAGIRRRINSGDKHSRSHNNEDENEEG